MLDEMLSTSDPKLAQAVVSRMQKTGNATLSARKAAVQNLRTAEQNAQNNAAAARNRITRAMAAGNKPGVDAIKKVVNRTGEFKPSSNHYSTVMDAAQRVNKRGNI